VQLNDKLKYISFLSNSLASVGVSSVDVRSSIIEEALRDTNMALCSNKICYVNGMMNKLKEISFCAVKNHRIGLINRPRRLLYLSRDGSSKIAHEMHDFEIDALGDNSHLVLRSNALALGIMTRSLLEVFHNHLRDAFCKKNMEYIQLSTWEQVNKHFLEKTIPQRLFRHMLYIKQFYMLNHSKMLNGLEKGRGHSLSKIKTSKTYIKVIKEVEMNYLDNLHKLIDETLLDLTKKFNNEVLLKDFPIYNKILTLGFLRDNFNMRMLKNLYNDILDEAFKNEIKSNFKKVEVVVIEDDDKKKTFLEKPWKPFQEMS